MTITVQRAADRAHTAIDWLDSKHSFNFGEHYRSSDAGHGLLLVNNDDIVAPGAGFGFHGHRDMEIVTWVLSGTLEHHDSEGNNGVLYPGLAQRMSAGPRRGAGCRVGSLDSRGRIQSGSKVGPRTRGRPSRAVQSFSRAMASRVSPR